MKDNFDVGKYIEHLGELLVIEFDQAGNATHPCAVGSGREKAIIKKLEDILPAGIGVCSGFVIDSNGTTSSQCDIIIYEKHLAMVFYYGDSNYSYVSCESVIAVGEIKSDASIALIEETINKFKRIKSMNRDCKTGYRKFGDTMTMTDVLDESKEFFPDKNDIDNIYTFFFSKTLSTNTKLLVDKFTTQASRKEYISLIASLDKKVFAHIQKTQDGKCTFAYGGLQGNALSYIQDEQPFLFLIKQLFNFIQQGRTSPLCSRLYIPSKKFYQFETVDY